jgi:hypothetical protein
VPVILATQEADIRRITIQSQPRQIVRETLSQKNLSQKRAGGVAQGVSPEFKPQCLKKKKNRQGRPRTGRGSILSSRSESGDLGELCSDIHWDGPF